jgi:HSP20 family protein
MLAKSPKESDIQFRFGPSRAWIDEMFRDGERRRSFKIEETHEGDALVVRAELPGVDPEKDVTVEVVEDTLVIRVQRTESHMSDTHHVHRSEFRYGSFSRSVPIPSGVDESTVAATYKDGILEVRLPSPAEPVVAASHRVEVKRG